MIRRRSFLILASVAILAGCGGGGGGQSSQTTAISCEGAFHAVGDKCVPDSCPAGFHLEDNECKVDPTPAPEPAPAEPSWKTDAKAVIASVRVGDCRARIYDGLGGDSGPGLTAYANLKVALEEGKKRDTIRLTDTVRNQLARYC